MRFLCPNGVIVFRGWGRRLKKNFFSLRIKVTAIFLPSLFLLLWQRKLKPGLFPFSAGRLGCGICQAEPPDVDKAPAELPGVRKGVGEHLFSLSSVCLGSRNFHTVIFVCRSLQKVFPVYMHMIMYSTDQAATTGIYRLFIGFGRRGIYRSGFIWALLFT